MHLVHIMKPNKQLVTDINDKKVNITKDIFPSFSKTILIASALGVYSSTPNEPYAKGLYLQTKKIFETLSKNDSEINNLLDACQNQMKINLFYNRLNSYK